MTLIFRVIPVLVAALTLVACNKPAEQTADAPAASSQSATSSGAEILADFREIETKIPTAWISQPPSNSMRVAQFVTSNDDKKQAEVIVFFFPNGIGGTQDANIARWTSQFSDGKGGQVAPKVEKTVINGMAVTRVELNGTYSRNIGMGIGAGAKPDQTLLAAIITTPADGNCTIHLHGPQSVVNEQRAAFEKTLKNIRFKG